MPNLVGSSMFNRLQQKAKAQYGAEVTSPYNQYNQQAQAALPKLYQPAYQAISQQFEPQFNQARNYLSANPALANSGAGSALNRNLLMGAYGQLGQSMAGESAGAYRGGLDLLSQLIQSRVAAQREKEAQKQKKKGFNPLGALGAGLSLIPGVGPVAGKIITAAGQ